MRPCRTVVIPSGSEALFPSADGRAITLPSAGELEALIAPEAINRLRRLGAGILSAPFRAVGPRDQERLFNEIIIDSLAPFLLGLIRTGDHLRCVDLGCGIGIPMLMLAAVMSDSFFIGIDSATKRIAFGRELARQTELTHVEFKEMRLRLDDDDHPANSALSNAVSADLYIARAIAKPDRVLPFVLKKLLGGGRRFLLYSTLASLDEHEMTVAQLRQAGATIKIHPYFRAGTGAKPLIAPNYCIFEMVCATS